MGNPVGGSSGRRGYSAEEIMKNLEAQEKPKENPRDYLSSVRARAYDACKDLKGVPLEQCQNPAEIQNILEQRADEIESLLQSGDTYSNRERAAVLITKLGVNASNAPDFRQKFSQYYTSRIRPLLNRIGSEELMFPFLASQDSKNPQKNLIFNGPIQSYEGALGVTCSFARDTERKESLSASLETELLSWMKGVFLCFEPAIKKPNVVAQAPDPEPTPDPSPEPVPQMAAQTEVKEETKAPKSRKQTPKSVSKPKAASAPGVASLPPMSVQELCKQIFPAQKDVVWQQANKVPSPRSLAKSEWQRCGYRRNTAKQSWEYTPIRGLRFDSTGNRAFFEMEDGTWETVNFKQEDGRLVGLHENPSKWLIPLGMGGPRGKWGPIEIRETKDGDLLLRFRIPSTDGKDYFYAYAIAKKGAAL